VFPIVGGRKVEYLQDNIQALTLHLSDEQIKYLESESPFDVGFPLNMIGDPLSGLPGIGSVQSANLEYQLVPKPWGHQ
jgi:hypothetical protein